MTPKSRGLAPSSGSLLLVKSFACNRKPAACLKRPAAALPPGWRMEKRTRKSGKSEGITDKYYVAPDGGICRSMQDVAKYSAC